MKNLYSIQQKYLALGIGNLPPAAVKEGLYRAGHVTPSTERGFRSTAENQMFYLQNFFGIDYQLRATILDIRHMHRIDPRVKKIHGRTARAAIKGGLRLEASSDKKRLHTLWQKFERRLNLHNTQKLESDAKGLLMEGNLPMQWVLDSNQRIVSGVRMPAETIVPQVGKNGQFIDPSKAFIQWDILEGKESASFPLWQLSLVRLDPENWDDKGCMGRPYLDASRTVWQKLMMTEDDLVLRRHARAPQRKVHVLEGATDEALTDYKMQTETAMAQGVQTDYYLNRKGSVSSLDGDAHLDQIADVAYLLDTFFSGAPAPKGLFGYTDGLSRDVLEDMKRDYFEELDALQDLQAMVYEQGFRLDLLLQGINPDNYRFKVKFAERRTETPSQSADRALKIQALGASQDSVWRIANLDPKQELEQREAEQKSREPYPDDDDEEGDKPKPKITITENNAKKGESATDVSND